MMGTIVIFVNLIIDSASAYQILQHASQYMSTQNCAFNDLFNNI